MNAIVKIPAADVPEIGAAFEGGFFAGRIRLLTAVVGIIAAPRAQGDFDSIPWGEYGKDIAGARSYFDGLANTMAMAEAGSELAKTMLALEIGGVNGWYLPARDELELLYRAFKPTNETNWVFRHGDNPSSLPAGYPYTSDSPAMSALELFRESGTEAFKDTWYWSSTQCSSNGAWYQLFGDGGQIDGGKDASLRARAVRRFIIE